MLGAYGGYGMSPYNSYGGGSAYGSVSPYGYNQPYYGGSASSSWVKNFLFENVIFAKFLQIFLGYGGYPSTGYYGGNSYGYGTYGSSYPYYGGVVG